MNGEDVLVALILGLSLSLALAGAARNVLGQNWPVQHSRYRINSVMLAVTLAVLAGPGILIDRLIDDCLEGNLGAGEIGMAIGASLAWATLYGFVFLGLLSGVFALPA